MQPIMPTRQTLSSSFVVVLFVVLSAWWTILFFGGGSDQNNLIWAASYQSVAIFGGVIGLIYAHKWGGIKSLMGRAMGFFSLGLLAQSFGQTVFSFYNLVLKVEVPYPSLADIGFFSTILIYVVALYFVGRVVGVRVNLRTSAGRLQAVLLPLILLGASYLMFLYNYTFDWSAPLRIFLDLGYPFGDAIYISIAILVWLLSRNVLGGLMRRPIVFLIIALVGQYIADFNFLYQAANGTWINGGYGDYLYLVAYFLMALAIVGLGNIFDKLSET